MSRRTFVIQVYAAGPSTLENLSTQERVPIADLAAVGAQIERWLAREKRLPVRSAKDDRPHPATGR